MQCGTPVERHAMKKRPLRRGTFLLVIVVVVASAVLIPRLLDRLLLPWAYGQTALTDRWVGSFTTATGQQRGMLLDMRLAEAEGRGGLVRDWEHSPHGDLAGTARLCDERGEVRAFDIAGEPDNFRATRLTFHLSPVEAPPPEGLTPNWVQGVWDRSNSLDLQVGFHWRKGDGSISGPEYPDTMTTAMAHLERGDETAFQDICAVLRQR
jgi:hypothetical protein